MTDLRTLLHHAAPAPPGPVDTTALALAAGRPSRRRRVAIWFGALGATLAVVATGLELRTVSPAGETTVEARRRETPADERVGAATPTSAGAATTTTGAQPGIEAPRPTTATALPSGAAPAGREQTAAPDSDGPATATGGAPGDPDEGCSVDGRSTANVGDANGGVGVSEFPSCRYMASGPGGYSATGRWEIRIVRKGQTLVVTSRDNAPCGTGVIQAGDDVRATLRANTNDPPDWYVRVGAKERCL